MKKQKIGVSYIFFYILFFPDTYRIIIGLLVAWLLAPSVIGSRLMTQAEGFMVWLMIAVIGYTISGRIGNLIADRMKNFILPDRKNK
ncbi:MAG: hypothetical protein R6U27_02225 [Desulfobacterales bacterium]